MRFHLMSSCLAGSVLMAQAAIGQTVTVQSGDSLYSIARTHLGSGAAWSELCAANSELLNGDCNRLSLGMVLTLPGQPDGQPAAEPTPVVEAEPAPVIAAEPEVEVEAEPVVEAAPEAAAAPAPTPVLPQHVVYDFSALEDAILRAPAELTVDHQLPTGPAQLSGNVEGLASSGAPGIYLTVPDEVELAASGREVVIAVMARVSTPGAIDIAYSTSEVGNSGWQRFELGTDYERIEMRYTVPEMVRGNKDYLGFRPDPMGTGQVLEISTIDISVAE